MIKEKVSKYFWFSTLKNRTQGDQGDQDFLKLILYNLYVVGSCLQDKFTGQYQYPCLSKVTHICLIFRWYVTPHCIASTLYTVWSEGFLYKVAPPELKISPIMFFVIHNSVVWSKILKIVVPFWPLFSYVDYYQNNQFYRVKFIFFKILL